MSKLKQHQKNISQSNHLTEKGKELLLAKKYEEAISVFTSALKINNINNEAKFYWAITFLDMGRPKKAIH